MQEKLEPGGIPAKTKVLEATYVKTGGNQANDGTKVFSCCLVPVWLSFCYTTGWWGLAGGTWCGMLSNTAALPPNPALLPMHEYKL
jgi:hypothetical protein